VIDLITLLAVDGRDGLAENHQPWMRSTRVATYAGHAGSDLDREGELEHRSMFAIALHPNPASMSLYDLPA
jgi:hypothetical protein